MALHGLIFKGELTADHVIHRVAHRGRQDRKAQSMSGTSSIRTASPRRIRVYGCYMRLARADQMVDEGRAKVSKAERRKLIAKMKADEKAHAEAERNKHENTAAKANAIWNAAKPAPINHPYLVRKVVQPHGLRVGEWVKDIVDEETGEVTGTSGFRTRCWSRSTRSQPTASA